MSAQAEPQSDAPRDRRAPDEAEEIEEGGRRRGRKRLIREEGMIPPVVDQTGQRVQESFQIFLEEWVLYRLL